MEINTKYSIGDSVFYMRNNTVNESRIKKISVNVHPDMDIRITYYVFITSIDEHVPLGDEEVFPTKQELLDSL